MTLSVARKVFFSAQLAKHALQKRANINSKKSDMSASVPGMLLIRWVVASRGRFVGSCWSPSGGVASGEEISLVDLGVNV